MTHRYLLAFVVILFAVTLFAEEITQHGGGGFVSTDASPDQKDVDPEPPSSASKCLKLQGNECFSCTFKLFNDCLDRDKSEDDYSTQKERCEKKLFNGKSSADYCRDGQK